MRWFPNVTIATALVAAALGGGAVPTEEGLATPADEAVAAPVAAAPAGGNPGAPSSDADVEVCTTSCGVGSGAPPSQEHARLQGWLDDYARQPAEASSLALESLLFFGAQVTSALPELDLSALDAEHVAVLETELARRTVWFEMRLVDERGRLRFELPPTAAPLDVKQHVHPEAALELQPPEISGTIRRVGQHHLWARL